MTAARLPLLRTSSLKTWMTCARRYRFEHVQGFVRVEEAHALRFGTLWHLLMESYLGAVRDGTDPLQALSRLDGESVDPWDLAKLRPLYLGYVARWGDEDRETLTVLAIEREYQHDLVNPDTGRPSATWRFGGRLDAEVEIGGRRLVLEHKTSSEDISPGSDYWRQKRIDAQASNYLAATGAEGNIYDVVKKPTIRPLKATPAESRKHKKDGKLYAAQRDADETSEEYQGRFGAQIAEDPNAFYQRGEVVRTLDELTEAARDRWELGKQIAEGVRLNRFPRNTAACFPLAGSPCPFASVCAGEASIDSPMFIKKAGFP